MSNIKLIGLDLAKDHFQLCGLNQAQKVVFNDSVKRDKLLETILTRKGAENATIAMEACGSAHHWARVFRGHGFHVVLVPPHLVKGFARGNKNDAKDALAIAECALRPKLHPVQVKTIEQQEYQALLRYRSRQKQLQIAASNQARGLLAEFGLVFPKSAAAFKRAVPELLEDGDNDLTPVTRKIIYELYEEYMNLGRRIADLDKEVSAAVHAHPLMKCLTKLRGIGPITAMALFTSIGKARHFKNARMLPAWIGLVPRQHGTGGKIRLGPISKRGDQYLRILLIHGARTVLNWAKKRTDALSMWVKQLAARRGRHKAIVALANKTARIVWVALNKGIEHVPAQHLAT